MYEIAIIFVLLVINDGLATQSSACTNYAELGDDWDGKCIPTPNSHQSPISFWADDVIVNSSIPKLQLVDYHKNVKVNVMYVCPFSKLILEENLPRLSGGGLNGEFKLIEIHMHLLSEHMLGDDHKDAEIHLVHAQDNTNQLAVIGVFIHVDTEAENTNPFLKEWIDIQQNISDPLQSHKALLSHVGFLTKSNDKFLRYDGSLTTPPCDERVNWIVLPTPILITQDDLFDLQKFHHQPRLNYNKALTHTERRVQPLNGRIVQCNVDVHSLPSKSQVMPVWLTVLIIFLCIAFILGLISCVVIIVRKMMNTGAVDSAVENKATPSQNFVVPLAIQEE